MSEKMATNEALHSAPFDQFTSDTDRVFDFQEHNWNSSEKSSLQMENNEVYRQQSSPEKPTIFESPHNIFSQMCRFSLKRTTAALLCSSFFRCCTGTAHTRPVLYRAEAFPESGSGFLIHWLHRHRKKNSGLHHNDFRNTDSAKYLAQLSPDCSSLPLKPDPEKGNRWKLASVLTSRMGLFSFYPLSHILDLGKEKYKSGVWEGHDSAKS